MAYSVERFTNTEKTAELLPQRCRRDAKGGNRLKCFYHLELDAAGICPQCGKAACHNCLKEVEGGILCKGCIAQRLRTVETEKRAVVQEQLATVEQARKRLRVAKIVFRVFFAFGIVVATGLVVQTIISEGSGVANVGMVLVSGILGAAIVGYYAWSFYWGVPAVWRGIRRIFTGIRFFVILNPATTLIVVMFFFAAFLFGGELYCIFGGGWSQYRKNLRIANT